MNYKKISYIILFIFLPLFISCEVGVDDSIPEGIYIYTAFDSLGTAVSKGWIKIGIKDSTIFGSWEIDKIGNPQNIGPQIGKGELEGNFSDNKMVIGLNPDYVDNNIVLDGSLKENKLTGKWYYSSFIGLTNWGTFEAVKMRNE
ncbi:MAG TPA: hypothetical protein VLN45_13020 [Ignavibacteriaceae bacterium]|nr:hypothetical protein [Ignavibacteriaceae bacterium]